MCGICIQLLGHVHSRIMLKWRRAIETWSCWNGAGAVEAYDCARAWNRKQRDGASEESKKNEKESDRLRKKRCIQGEF